MRAALGDDGGVPGDGAAESPRVCTRMPLGWLARCDEPHFDGHPLCAALRAALGASDDARGELLALQLNIASSDDGTDPPGLGDLRFHAGARRRQTLREWAAEGAERAGRHADVAEAARVAFDANRSFLACLPLPVPPNQDQGLPICGDPTQRAVGPKGASCAALDSDCGRGELDASAGCCRVAPRPSGVPCAHGVCNDSGACVAPRRPAEPRSRAPRDGFVGYAYWVESFGREVFIWTTDTGLDIRLDGATAVELARTRPPIDLSEVHVKTQGPQAQYGAVLVGAPSGMRTMFVPRIAQSTQACLVTGSIDALGRVASDGSSQGTTTLDCPGTSGPFSCTIDDQVLRVSGPDISLAWERWLPKNEVPDDVHTDMLPMCLLPELCMLRDLASCSPACRIGSMRECGCPTRPTGSTFARCQINGCWGRCEFPPEVCNGFDDDCDGVIDENTNTSCDDGIACTLDSCAGGLCAHDRSGGSGICNDFAACTLEACGASPPVADPVRDHPRAGPRSNGCFYVDRDSYCTDEWDACECNGAEACVPAGQTFAQLTGPNHTDGCVPGRRRDYPCELHTSGGDPSDGSACTQELCWEEIQRPGGAPVCRFLRADVERCAATPPDPVACARLEQYNQAGDFASAPIIGVGTAVSTAYGDVWCVTDGPGVPPPIFPCDDGLPCTYDICTDPVDGFCSNPDVPDGPHPGCDAVFNRGCAVHMCVSGACTDQLHSPDESDPSQDCQGQAFMPEPGSSDRLVFPTCADWACRHTVSGTNADQCVAVLPTSNRCDDGSFCDGAETCGTAQRDTSAAPGPAGLLHGCVRSPAPCVDGFDCTTNACDEATDACSVTPVDSSCMGWKACDPANICDLHAGCTAPPPGYNACDDANPLTDDFCVCQDEFCQTKQCLYSPHPIHEI